MSKLELSNRRRTPSIGYSEGLKAVNLPFRAYVLEMTMASPRDTRSYGVAFTRFRCVLDVVWRSESGITATALQDRSVTGTTYEKGDEELHCLFPKRPKQWTRHEHRH